MDIRKKIARAIYLGLGGDPKRNFDSAEDIYNEINNIKSEAVGRVTIEPLNLDVTTNGVYKYDNKDISGYKPVEVNVNVDVGTAYDDGYNAGIAEQKSKLKSINIIENGNYTNEDGYNEIKVSVRGKLEIPFEEISYPSELKNEINNELNSKPLSDLEYSKSLYDKWDPSKTTAYSLYEGDNKLVYAPNIDTSNITNTQYMFQGCSSLTTVPLFDTSKVTDMGDMFNDCSSLTTVPLFDTSKVTMFSYVFIDCSSLTTVPLFDTSNVIIMNRVFSGCSSLTTVPLFDTSKVTTMSYMFQGCSSLTTVPLFDTSKVTDMSNMFQGCSSLTAIPLFDMSKVTTMYSMFDSCKALTAIPLFDTSKVNNISYIFGFSDLTNLTDIGGFKNLGMQPTLSVTSGYVFNKVPNMTHESVMNIINNLYDRKSAGYSVVTLKFATKTLALLSDDEIAIATNKGWILS